MKAPAVERSKETLYYIVQKISKIILIGFMGSGKSSTAKRAGQILRLPVLEMDELVLQKTNAQNMREVFAKGGESLLRGTEMLIAREQARIGACIISTGGGVVLNKTILEVLKKPDGKIFFLRASFQTIAARLAADTTRPLFKNILEAEALYSVREPLYLERADQVIEVDGRSVDEIAQEIAMMRSLRKHGK